MNIDDRIKSFAILGETLRNALSGNDLRYSEELNLLAGQQHINNQWFTPDNVKLALNSIANELTTENLTRWTSAYPGLRKNKTPFRAGVIMAGNIPLVGFHDFLSVLISGNILIAKTSSKDSDLIKFIAEILCTINPDFSEFIQFTTDKLSGFDAVIATGSNNSSRYFEYYFGRYPNIIRKNRNSVGIITGDESSDDIRELGKDIFTYFGLGCRNVSKIWLPRGYDLTELTAHWGSFSNLVYHNGYANNYDFNKAVYIVNREKFHDAGHLLMREDTSLTSPISVLHFEYYDSENTVIQQTEMLSDRIQCIAGKNHIAFGTAQAPRLWDYADGIDTLEFLQKIK
jgi:hypothetical protein